MSLKAMNDYLLVRPEDPVTKTTTGLYLDVSQVQTTGLVVSAGSLCKSKVRPGDRVLFPKGMKAEEFIDYDDPKKAKYWIVTENRILLVLNDGV